jgi:3-dehydrosphinganine reductase
VTGGSSGIGRALALQLVEAGAHVYIAARDRARLEQTLAELRQRAVNAEQRLGMVALDVGDREAVSAAAPELVAGLGGIDLVINNAGITHPAAFLDTPEELFDAIMRINYFGSVHVTRALLPAMIAGGGGRIAFVSSLAGLIGVYGYSAYAASKFAIRGFAECLRQELMHQGIGVSVVLPPDTDTEQLANENKIKPPETHAIAGTVKVLSPEYVARVTLTGIRRGRYHVVPGFGAKFTVFMAHGFPRVTQWFIDSALRRSRRRQPPKMLTRPGSG